MREKIALAELRFRMLKQGREPTRAEQKAAITAAHAKHAKGERDLKWQRKNASVPAHRRI